MKICALSACLLSAAALFAQSPGGIAGGGYNSPAPLRVAPGQVITMFVHTSAVSVANRVAASAPLPTSLGGISIQMLETFANPMWLPVLAVAPAGNCVGVPAAVPCTPLTAITTQIPMELIPNAEGPRKPDNFASLTVYENGVRGDSIQLAPVAVNIHIVNTCDATEAPTTAACTPEIRHADGSLVNHDNPAHANESIVVTAYGLGRTSDHVTTGDVAPSPATPLSDMHAAVVFGTGVTPSKPPSAGTASAVLKSGTVGQYQVTYVIPAVPSNAPDCSTSTVLTNATLSVSRGNSFDGAPLCIVP